ncbi:MAG: tRNA (guanosine(37)-N1)-methyltransferase TrmD [Candidatus Omnitrophica bacterium]|nr:tRNA (guanosine(37)-N1)-methyltransferase TrmD [Candidatus Omnitrophota bacterium]
MKIDIVTIFPKMFEPVLNESIIKRAKAKGLVKIKIHDLRRYSPDKHRKIDDRPFGGGPGMVFRPEPVFRAIESIKPKPKTRVILLTPQGKQLDQRLAKRLSKLKHLVLICGHYEGIDQRVHERLVTDEISIGDYVLTCGELPAMVLVDSVVRLIPKVLGKLESTEVESFSQGLLEYPQYTRPAVYRKMRVPKVLLSGNHKLIDKWRKEKALEITRKKRPDLMADERRRRDETD